MTGPHGRRTGILDGILQRLLGRTAQASALNRLRKGIWRQRPVALASVGVTTMLTLDELRLLEALTEDYWSDAGLVVDAGCFLGGSTTALASGLRNRGISNRQVIRSYDLFQVEDWTRGVFFPQSVAVGADTRAVYDRNLAPLADLVEVHQGDITLTNWSGEPIELLFIDLAKDWVICDWITENLFPHLIPGKSIVVQQDYFFPSWTGWLHITMEYFADYFEKICDTDVNSAAFLLTKPFPEGVLKPDLVANMSREQHVALLDAATSRFDGKQAEYLHAAKQHFLEIFEYDDER